MERLTLKQMKAQAERHLAKFFSDPEPHPVAILSTEPSPGVTRANMLVLAGMGGEEIRATLDAFCAQHKPYAGILMFEAWMSPHEEGETVMPRDHPENQDAIQVVVDHESGIAFGIAMVEHAADPKRRRICELDWKLADHKEGRLAYVIPRNKPPRDIRSLILIVDPANDRASMQLDGKDVDCPECGSGGYALSEVNLYMRQQPQGDPFQRYLEMCRPGVSSKERLEAVLCGRCATCGAPPNKAHA